MDFWEYDSPLGNTLSEEWNTTSNILYALTLSTSNETE